MWQQSEWLLKFTRKSTREAALEVRSSHTGETLAEGIIPLRSARSAVLPYLVAIWAKARSDLRLKGDEAPCLTVWRGLTLGPPPITLFGKIQINDENKKALATFRGRPFMMFRGLELMSPGGEQLGHIRLILKPFRPLGQALHEPGGGLIGRLEFDKVGTARLTVSEKYAGDVAMKKVLFGVSIGYQMLEPLSG